MKDCYPKHIDNGRGRVVCGVHGSRWVMGYSYCKTTAVLEDVSVERIRQFAQYGTNADLEDGTGPATRWLLPIEEAVRRAADPMSADQIERFLRKAYEDYEEEVGKPTWLHLVLEEVAEAFQENDPDRLQAELLQVAALCVSWVEKIRERPVLPPGLSDAIDKGIKDGSIWSESDR